MNGRNRDSGNRKIIAMPGLKKDEPLNIKRKLINTEGGMNGLKHRNLNGIPDESESEMPVRTAESIESDTVIDLPVNLVRPMGSRIFCKAVPAFEKKTRAGIIMATSYEQQRGEDRIIRDYKRYFVIDVADDLTRTFKPLDPNQPNRKLQRGDEVFIFVPEDAKRYSPVEVIDWSNGAMRYVVFEEMEIAGAGLINLIQEEDKKE